MDWNLQMGSGNSCNRVPLATRRDVAATAAYKLDRDRPQMAPMEPY